jgi:hypothetical protein
MFWALAFACANGRTPGAFAGLLTQDAAFDAVKAFGIILACQRAEVEACVDFVLGKPSEKVPSSKDTARKLAQADWSRMIQFVEMQSGIPADVWLWGKSANYTLQSYTRQHETLIALAGGKADKAPIDALNNALTELAKIKKAIGLAHQTTEEAV